MDVFGFIATVLYVLVETRAASFENVELRFGENKFIFPLHLPIFVTRIKGANVVDMKLPLPDIVDLIIKSRASSSTPAASERFDAQPDAGSLEHRSHLNDSVENEDDDESYFYDDNLQPPNLLIGEQNYHNITYQKSQSEETEYERDSFEDKEEKLPTNSNPEMNSKSTVTAEKALNNSQLSFDEDGKKSHQRTDKTRDHITIHTTSSPSEEVVDPRPAPDTHIIRSDNLPKLKNKTFLEHIITSADDVFTSDHTPVHVRDTMTSYPTSMLMDDAITTESTTRFADDAVTLPPGVILAEAIPSLTERTFVEDETFQLTTPTLENQVTFSHTPILKESTISLPHKPETEDDVVIYYTGYMPASPQHAGASQLTPIFGVSYESTTNIAITSHPETTPAAKDVIILNDTPILTDDEVTSHPTVSSVGEIMDLEDLQMLKKEDMTSPSQQTLAETTYKMDSFESEPNLRDTNMPEPWPPAKSPTAVKPYDHVFEDQYVSDKTSRDIIVTRSEEDTGLIADTSRFGLQYDEKIKPVPWMNVNNEHKNDTQLTIISAINPHGHSMTPDLYVIEEIVLPHTKTVKETSTEIPMTSSLELGTITNVSETPLPVKTTVLPASYVFNDVPMHNISTESRDFPPVELNTATDDPTLSPPGHHSTTVAIVPNFSNDLQDTSRENLMSTSRVQKTSNNTGESLFTTQNNHYYLTRENLLRMQNSTAVSLTSNTLTNLTMRGTPKEHLLLSHPVKEHHEPMSLVQNETTMTLYSSNDLPVQEISAENEEDKKHHLKLKTLTTNIRKTSIFNTTLFSSMSNLYKQQNVSAESSGSSATVLDKTSHTSSSLPPIDVKNTTMLVSNSKITPSSRATTTVKSHKPPSSRPQQNTTKSKKKGAVKTPLRRSPQRPCNKRQITKPHVQKGKPVMGVQRRRRRRTTTPAGRSTTKRATRKSPTTNPTTKDTITKSPTTKGVTTKRPITKRPNVKSPTRRRRTTRRPYTKRPTTQRSTTASPTTPRNTILDVAT